MTTKLEETSSAICEAQSYLFEIDKSASSLYMLLDEFQVQAERGQLSTDVVEDVSATLQDELPKAVQPITRALEIIACSIDRPVGRGLALARGQLKGGRHRER